MQIAEAIMIKHPAMEEVYWRGISEDPEDSEPVSELLTRFSVFTRSISEFGFLLGDRLFPRSVTYVCTIDLNCEDVKVHL